MIDWYEWADHMSYDLAIPHETAGRVWHRWDPQQVWPDSHTNHIWGFFVS